MKTAVASIFVFGIIIFIHEFGHFITAKLRGVKVLEFAIGMGPKLFGWTKNGTDYSLRLLPIGGYCAMEGEEEESEAEDSFNNASWFSRFLICIAGAFNNIVLGLLILGILTATGTIASKTIYQFTEGSSTQASGLMENDTFVSINGRKLYTADDIYYEMMWVEDGVADVVVMRDGELVTIKDVQFKSEKTEDGINVIQIDFYVYAVRKTVWNVIKSTVCKVLSLTRQIYMSLIQLLTGTVSANQLSGPVGIISTIGEAASQSIEDVLFLMAYISINLGIMNILPIPALDGGRILLILAEAVTGKKLPQKWEIIINTVGLVLLLGLMGYVTFNDIVRLTK